MKKILLLTVLFILISCKKQTKQDLIEFKQTVIAAKTTDLVDGNINYCFAYTDGTDKNVSFGMYTKFNVGDTICWEREKEFFGMWYIVDCKQNKSSIKTEYKIELVNQDSIKIYSVSNDTVYNCLYTDMEKVIELDNL